MLQHSHHKIILALALIFVFIPGLAHAAPADSDTVRVGLASYFSNVKQITVSATSDINIVRTGSNEKITSYQAPISIEAGAKSITIKEAASAGSVTSITITPANSAVIISIDAPGRRSKQYRGSIEINLKSGLLQLVNVIDVEDYLPGVVPAEMPSSYPDEALKAQAITARTYALCNHRKHTSLGYDICDRTCCQAYEGVLAETPKTAKAVSDTQGIVLTYNSQLAEVLYSADCGGVTQDYTEERLSSSFPYLCSVREPNEVVHRCWEQSYPLPDLAQKLLRARIKEADGLASVIVSKLSPSGRVQSIDITGKSGTTTITGDRFRDILDLKSRMFGIETSAEGSVTIKGKGFGHGVGLCQVGARCLAQAPLNYTCNQILMHYFTGAQVSIMTPTGYANVETPAPAKKETLTAYIPTIEPSYKSKEPVRRSAKASNGQGPRDAAKFQVRVKAPEKL